MKTFETKMPSCKSVSRGATVWVLAFGIFVAALAFPVPSGLAQSTYEPYTFTTLAGLPLQYDNSGNVVAVSSGARTGRGATHGLPGHPEVAVDSAGNAYVADSGNNTIRKAYPALEILNSGPGFGFNGGQFGLQSYGASGAVDGR